MRNRLIDLLDQFPNRRLAVVGDLIADQFMYGQISRISREAPVLILNFQELVAIPGGAANAAHNLLDLACSVKVLGTVGKDEAGRNMLSALSSKGADLSQVLKDANYTTPVKTRILASAYHSAPHQLLRIDRVPQSNPVPKRTLKSLLAALKSCDAVILSDYGNGTIVPELVDRVRAIANKRGIPVVVDSRYRMTEFRGVTSITPNITELESALGVSIGGDTKLLRRLGNRVVREQRLDSLLVTQGRFGMTLFQPSRPPLHIPIFGSDEVADITGAGDTVIAVFTAALACGASAEEAARLANYAGGIVVMKRGTATVTRDELRAAIIKDLPI
jgi:rfaE bifunctional protein kinase chain/domain